MSTKQKKIYNKEDIKCAQEEIKKVEKRFKKKSSKRKTVQVRVNEKWHKRIKEVAGPRRITLSSFLDKICEYFFRNYE
jgi:hypothetical protein